MEVMEQRRNDIVNFINDCGTVHFNQLKERFPNVSDMTLRTDLKILDQQQRIVRIHGGAKSLEKVTGNDDYLKTRTFQHIEEKKEIALKALEFVIPNQTIFIDSGSTTTSLASLLPDQANMYFTNSITCATELAKLSQAHCQLAGGTINRNSLSVTGLETIRFLENINFDIAFLGVTRYSSRTGFSCESYHDAQVKKAACKQAKKVIVLMDSSKTDQDGTYTFCNLNNIDVVISDSNLSAQFVEECKSQGVIII